MQDLLSGLPVRRTLEPIDDGAVVLRGFVSTCASELLREVELIRAVSPFRHLTTPGGHVMSVAMTNCGDLGWVSDRRGYRYQRVDPLNGKPWPAMPGTFQSVAAEAAEAAGYARFAPEACLINRYEPGARLSLHQDRTSSISMCRLSPSRSDFRRYSCSAGCDATTGRGGYGLNMAMLSSGAVRRGLHSTAWNRSTKDCMRSLADAASISRSARRDEACHL